MNGTKISTAKLFCIGLLTTAAYGAGPEYLPLEVGNTWTYRVTQGRAVQPAVIEVVGRETVNSNAYYRLNAFGTSALVRQSDDGSLVMWNTEASREMPYLPLGAPEGVDSPAGLDTCSRTARVASRAAKVKTLVGEFDNALELRFVPNCADAGATVQYFLPYVGLLVYEQSSIAGPVRYELMYSRTGFTTVEAKSNAFTIGTDAQAYKAGESTEMVARVTLKASEPIQLTFPSGQNTDLRIYNERGESVYIWSADKLFSQAVREVTIQPGERSWVMQAPLSRLAPGRYVAEGWLTTTRRYSATVTFEIVQ